MKKFNILIITVLMLSITSCSNKMEFPQAATFNLQSVFSKYSNAEKMLFDMYSYPIPMNFDTRDFGSAGTRMAGGAFASAITDEGQPLDLQSGYQVQRYYNGNVEPSTCASWSSAYKGEDDYSLKWKTIRKAYVIMDNIDKVPNSTFPTNDGVSPEDKKLRIKAECKLMIALVYFEMLKRYGGVPLIKDAFSAAADYESMKVKRSTFKETYDFINNLLADLMTNYVGKLPANLALSTNGDVEYGRFPMSLAYALKARLELYAASPLFNTDHPYSTALGQNSNLICFMNYDKERWKKAADAATAAINYCLANGYKVVDDPTKRDNAMNYTVANIEYPVKGNTEVIWGIAQAPGILWGYYNSVRGSTIYGYGANLVPLNQVERYELKTSTSGQYKSWDAQQSYDVAAVPTGSTTLQGDKIVAIAARKAYEGLDPRLEASIVFNGQIDYSTLFVIDFADAYTDNGVANASRNGAYSKAKQGTTIVQYVRKFERGYETTLNSCRPLNIYMRMAELYLIRAEALNEYSGPQQQTYDDLNFIRTRSGMPNVKTGVAQDEMRDIIAHERNIEMFYEDQRWFDLRRTLKSEQKIPVNIYRPLIRKWYRTTTDVWPYKITYDKQLYSTRVWFNKWYMNPFPSQEVDKGYGLIQNPGW
jgi:starch-binding outer membrane protein, SusD/RagB family